MDILQDSRGLMWFSTKDGLNRYDGYEFKTYSHLPFDSFSISGHITKALFEDKAGRLWVGTENNGLNVFDPVTEKFWHIQQKNDQQAGLSSNTIRSIQAGKDGCIWVGTPLGLDQIVLPDGFDLSKFADKPQLNDFVNIINYQYAGQPFSVDGICVENDMIYIGSTARFFTLDVKNKHQIIERTNQVILPEIRNLHFGIQAILALKEGNILVSTLHDLVLIKSDQIVHYPLPAELRGAVPKLLMDQTGVIWGASTMLFKFNPELSGLAAFEVVLKNENTPIISSLFSDRSNILWLGTNGYGIIKYNSKAKSFKHFLSGSSASTRQLYVDQQNRYWVWHYDFSLECIDPKTGALYFPDGFPYSLRNARWLLQAQNGHYWFHFPFSDRETKLVRFDPVTRKLTDYIYDCETNPMSPMIEDKDGNIWFGCKQGQLVKLDAKQGKYHYFDFAQQLHPDFAEANVTALWYDENGIFWIGTPYGLIRFEPGNATQAWKMYRHDTKNLASLSDDYILSIHASQSEQGILWIGTKGGGLNRFRTNDETFTALSTRDGLPNNVIYGILEEKNGNLWLSTNGGLSQYSPVHHTFLNYTYFDGLQSNEFNAFSYAQAKDGTLFFGGINGVNIFHPDSLKRANSHPEVIFTEIRVNDQVLSPLLFQQASGIIQFQHHQNLFHFKFAINDYTSANKNTFRFQMEGIDPAPIFLGNQREVVYAQLHPGQYTLKVWGANTSGIWSAPAELSFIILPPWWKTTAAYMVYFLLAISLILLVYRFQINRIKLSNQLEFEHRETLRLEEINRMKSNFFSNITHEFRTPLTLLLEPARQLFQRNTIDNDDRELLRIIIKNAQQLLQLINQLLDLSKIESGFMQKQQRRGNLIESLQTTYRQFLPLAEKQQIHMRFRSSHAIYETLFDQEKIEQCLSNLLSNAIKFTPAGGSVTLSTHIVQEDSTAQAFIEVQDTGVGIDNEQLPFIFDRFHQGNMENANFQKGTGIGLSLVKELVKLLGGEVRVESQAGQGSTFTLIFPLDHADTHIAQPVVQEISSASSPHTAMLDKKAQDGASQLILIVEDNPDLRQFLVQSLKPHYQVITAVNGEEGWQKAAYYIPDLIISDVLMPIKGGLELLAQIKQEATTAAIPVILLTAKSSGNHKMEGLKAGADDYITKPFQTEELLAKIAQLIEQRQQLQALYGQPTEKTDKTSADAPLINTDDDFLKRFTLLLDKHLENEALSVELLAQEMNLSRSQLHRKLKAHTNQSVTEMLRNYRLDRAMALLKNQHESVGQVAASVGFPNQQYFATIFKKRFGCSPSDVAMPH